MKTLTALCALILLTGATFGQELKKGNLVGMHTMDLKLEPGVTMEEFADFYVKEVIPVFEKNHAGWKAYAAKRIRGETAKEFGLLIVVQSERDRNKYYNPDGSPTDLGNAAVKNLESVMERLNKLGTISAHSFTDWLVH
jgi:hypothetical protein